MKSSLSKRFTFLREKTLDGMEKMKLSKILFQIQNG